jgi:hypothetical protein
VPATAPTSSHRSRRDTHRRHVIIRAVGGGKIRIIFEHTIFDPNTRRDSRDTDALIAGVRASDIETVRRLLERNVYADSNDGCQTALMIAAGRGDTAIAQALIRAGADVDRRTWDGWTALMIASDCKHVDVVKLLAENGATGDFEDGRGTSALTLAKDAPEILRLLEQARDHARRPFRIVTVHVKEAVVREEAMPSVERLHAQLRQGLAILGRPIEVLIDLPRCVRVARARPGLSRRV